MHEHRLIERMVRLLQSELDRLSTEETLDPDFILAAVDFFRTYADRTHHGKEEDILFVALEKKTLDDGLRSIMDELIEEHIYARARVGARAIIMIVLLCAYIPVAFEPRGFESPRVFMLGPLFW